MLKLVIVISCFLANCFIINAQSKCPVKSLYLTDSVGDEKEKLKMALFFIISKDSVTISWDVDGETPYVGFKILSEECNWNKDTSIGFPTYKLELLDRGKRSYPTLTIQRKANNEGYIEILYENGEKRVFTIRKQKLQN